VQNFGRKLAEKIGIVAQAGSNVSVGEIRVEHPLLRQDYRNRQALLTKVRNFWVKGVLEKSLHEQVLISLGLQDHPDAVESPWDLMLGTENQPPQDLPPDTSVISIFDDIGEGRTLLILGEPGSGKTITLLQLARDLIARAEQDANQRIPVVFNLSSWKATVSHKRRVASSQTIAEWLVEELSSKYQVPRKIGEAWIKRQQLLLLLDGLDEVRADERDACITAINEFQQEFGTEIVVCCRIKDYEALKNRLNFQSAIYLRSLSSEQVQNYLNCLTADLTGLKTLLAEDTALQELAQSPLMLNIMVLAYEGMAVDQLPQTDVIAERRKQLFDKYIERMLKHRGAVLLYPKEKIVHWLIWLAQQMVKESQTVFLIEKMQPTLLQDSSKRFAYKSLNLLIIGLVVKLIGGLVIGLTFGLIIGLIAQQAFGLNYGLVTGIGSGFLGGSLIWLSDSNEYRSQEIEPFSKSLSWSWQNSKIGLILGLIAGSFFIVNDASHVDLSGNYHIFLTLLDLLFIGLLFGWLAGLSGRDRGCTQIGKAAKLVAKEAKEILISFLYGRIKQGVRKIKIIIRSLHGKLSQLCQGVKNNRSNNQVQEKVQETFEGIKLIEKISWSWQKSKTGFLIYLGGGSFFPLYIMNRGTNVFSSFKLTNEELIQVKESAIWIVLLILLSFSVISGFSISELEKKTIPNEGIWNSAKSSIKVALIFGFWKTTTGVLVGFLIGNLIGRSGSSDLVLGAALNLELITAIGCGTYWGILSGFMHGLEYGGKTCLKHFSLRLVLFSCKQIPWNYAKFLDYATERLFLQKVGGGYIFMHRLLMEHFAELELENEKRGHYQRSN
jgi:DNA polymerase III delta prime subunit